MTAYPQHPYPTPSASPQPPNPRLSRKPTFRHCPTLPQSQRFTPPLDIPSVAPCPDPISRPRTPVNVPGEEETDRRYRAALKAAGTAQRPIVGRSRSKEGAKREELGLTVVPPTPTTKHYMRKALPPVPGSGSQSKTDSARVEKQKRAPRAQEVNQLRGYKIDTPHPMKMSTGRTANEYLAAKRRRRAERDGSEAMSLVDLA